MKPDLNNQLKINPEELNFHSGRLCACIAQTDPAKCIGELSKYPLAELRADLCNLTTPDIEKIVSEKTGIIFTFKLSDKTLQTALEQTLAAIKSGVSYVDVDLDCPGIFLRKVKKAISDNSSADGQKTKLIISSHPASMPPLKTLEGIALKCRRLGADIVKIAPAAKNLEEASRVLRLYHLQDTEDQRRSLVAFAVGNAGKFTRVSCLSLGAPFTYCSTAKALAPGQLRYKEMLETLCGRNGAEPYRTGNMTESGLFSRFSKELSNSKRNMKEKSVAVPCSKSFVQRAVLAAGLCKGESILRNFDPCDDVKAAVTFLRKCGCLIKIIRDGRGARGEKMLIIRSAGFEKWKFFKFADVGESGLLARLLLPIAAHATSTRRYYLSGSITRIEGHGSLLKRDFTDTVQQLRKAGVKCKGKIKDGASRLPVSISGAAFKKSFTISARQSSQLVSGLLMVLPLEPHSTHMVVEDAVSIPFIEMTINILSHFGISIAMKKENRNLIFDIEGNQVYRPSDIFLEADWSGASNFAVGGAIASVISRKREEEEGLTVKAMSMGTNQADEAILGVLEQCGAKVKKEIPEMSEFSNISRKRFATGDTFVESLRNISFNAASLKAFRFDATDSPDLFPILTTLAVYCKGESRITGLTRLANKESNRALSILEEFTRMGYDVYVEGNDLVVGGNEGRALWAGGSKILCSSHNDHRIAMAVIICALMRNSAGNAPVDIYLDEVDCIDKSFPTFVKRLQMTI